jgi:glycolate oxidase FAD binding subunit
VAVEGVEAVQGEQAEQLAVDGMAPRLWARPDSPEALAAILRAAHGEGLAVLPRGGGTKSALGNWPRRYDLALQLDGLQGVLEYRPDDLVLVAFAGTTLAELQGCVAAHGQWLALDPPHCAAGGFVREAATVPGPPGAHTRKRVPGASTLVEAPAHSPAVSPHAARATLGGVLATNASGPHRLRYGTGRDLVLGMRVAYADGTLARSGAKVVKSVAGYDVHKLHVGALGTLGVIVEVALRLHPLPAARSLLAISAREAGELGRVVDMLIRGPIGLGALEALNAAAVRRLNEKKGGSLPEQPLLLALCEGLPRVVARQADEVARAAHGMAVDEVATGEAAAGLLGEVAELRVPRHGESALKISIPSGDTGSTLAELEATLGAAGRQPAVLAHAGSGVIHALCIPEGDGLAVLVRELRARLGARRGHLVVESCPPGAKQGLDVWGQVAAPRLMRELKSALDARATLNPGRFVEGL